MHQHSLLAPAGFAIAQSLRLPQIGQVAVSCQALDLVSFIAGS
jgi:hypothetical protein